MVAGTYSPQTSPMSALCWEKQCFPASILFLILSPSETAPQVCDRCFSVCLHGGSFGCVLKMFFTDLGGTDYEQIKTPASNQLSPKTTFTKNIWFSQQMNGSKNCGTFTQWNSTQQRERRSLYPLQQHGWNWRA